MSMTQEEEQREKEEARQAEAARLDGLTVRQRQRKDSRKFANLAERIIRREFQRLRKTLPLQAMKTKR